MGRKWMWRGGTLLVVMAWGSYVQGGGLQDQALTPDAAKTMREKLERLLEQELTEGWYPRSVDEQRGGFHQNYARDWTALPDTNTFLVYQARMAWTAAAYAEFCPERKQEFEKYARHGIEFLGRVMRDKEGGGFHWQLDAKGQVDPTTLGTEKHLYGTTFVIYAGSKVYEATGDKEALALAQEAFDWLDQHGHDAEHLGYFEAYERDGTPILSYDPSLEKWRRTDKLGAYYGFKSMNSHIHMLEAVAALARVDDRPVVRERLKELIEVVRDKVAVEPGALNLFLTRDWRAIPGHDSFGHDVETAYLLVEAAETLGKGEDEATWRMARMLVDHALDWGWDDEHGGFYDKGESFGGPAFDTDKVWWTQAEGLNALLLMHKKYGYETERYARAFLKQWQFIERHQLDPLHPGWFEETTREGQLLGDGHKASPWKANYHTARAMMNVSRMLKELEDDHHGEKSD